MLVQSPSKPIGTDARAYLRRSAALAPHYQAMRIKPERSLLGSSNQDRISRLDHLSALRDRLRAELEELDLIITDLEAGTAAERRALARYELGEILGATDLGRLLGVSRDTARRYLANELSDLSWTDRSGRLRIRRSDVEERLAEPAAGLGAA